MGAKQESYLESLAGIRYKTLTSDEYDEILIELTKYYNEMFQETKHVCPHCYRVFKFQKALKKHIRTKHPN